MNKVFFSGCGLTTSLGQGVDENITRLFRLADGDEKISRGQVTYPVDNASIDIPVHLLKRNLAGKNKEFSNQRQNYHILDQVIGEAIGGAGLSEQQLNRLGLFVGSTSVDINVAEQRILASSCSNEYCSNEDIAKNIPHFTHLTDYVIQKYNIEGPSFSFNTACTSSANALIYAAEFVRQGEIEHALVLGIEFSNRMSALGFSSLGLISSQGMRPFDKQRDGLYLGEGCGAVILSKQPVSHSFGLESGAYLGDKHNVTSCNPDGSTVAEVILHALTRAELNDKQISLVKAHGTASLSNDEAESAGLNLVFDKVPSIIVFKPYLGHTLGACGVIELILFYQCLIRRNRLPAAAGNITADPDLNIVLCQNETLSQRGYFLLNYFGFGGNNTALIISNVESGS